MRYLFDACSFLELVKQKKSRILENQYVLDLTFYELCNAIWKEVNLFKSINRNEGLKLIKSLEIILTRLNVLRIKEELSSIYNLAITEALTAYDATYIHSAEKNKLVLVTEDKKLYKKARKYVQVLNSNGILNTNKQNRNSEG
ncbi:MAG: type II toxin-antitoxin system VapC family toxin [Candidatus Njordarchaeia archaeon]|nr:type II toxin-antitoxin system VapC family toxin [Candidatus Korarchaeota archaeon]